MPPKKIKKEKGKAKAKAKVKSKVKSKTSQSQSQIVHVHTSKRQSQPRKAVFKPPSTTEVLLATMIQQMNKPVQQYTNLAPATHKIPPVKQSDVDEATVQLNPRNVNLATVNLATGEGLKNLPKSQGGGGGGRAEEDEFEDASDARDDDIKEQGRLEGEIKKNEHLIEQFKKKHEDKVLTIENKTTIKKYNNDLNTAQRKLKKMQESFF